MLRPTGSAARVVAGWLAPAASSSDDVVVPDFAPRPERLGLGARFVPHSAALSTVERAFSKQLKGREPAPAAAVAVRDAKRGKRAALRPAEDDDSDEDEGRSASVRKKPQKATQPGPAKKRRT
jgi:hypothetical protein